MTEKLDWALEVQSCWLHWKRLQAATALGRLVETLEERESELRALYLGTIQGCALAIHVSGALGSNICNNLQL